MKRSFVVILAVLVHFTVFAQGRSVEKAADIAAAFMRADVKTRAASMDLRMVWDGTATKGASDDPCFYLFDNLVGPGFVIVSAEESARTILGYSYDNELDSGNLPPHFVSWMNEIASQVEYVRAYPRTRTAEDNLKVGNVVVQLQTAQWNQDDPYNRQCPMDGADASVTGCVATATAIVMRYHQWPDAGKGLIPAYTTQSKGIRVPERIISQPYDWALMPMTFQKGKYTAKQADEVARLMADCGSMLEMDYSSESSGAQSSNIAKGLPLYMKYDSSVGLYARAYYDDEEWHSMLEKEINENGPVIYSGHSAFTGHCFVLDGYTSEHYYSVNWGWGGSCNGFYALDAMAPEIHGTGGSNEPYNFMQDAILNVKKDEGGVVEVRAVISPWEGVNGLETDAEELKRGVPFRIRTGLVQNYSSENYHGRFGFAVADKDDNVLELLYEHVADLPPYYGYHYDQELTFHIEPQLGYRIIAVIWDTHNNVWKKARGDREHGGQDFIPLADQFTIEESTQFEYNTLSQEIKLTLKDDVNVELYDSDGIDNSACLSVEGNTVRIATAELPAGRYRLVLTKGGEFKELYFVTGKKEEGYE